jgi:hypothetical protein
MYNLCRVFTTNQLAVLTVKSGLDPHMINLSEDEFKLFFTLCSWSWCYTLNCGDDIYLYLLVSKLLNKIWPTKMLKCLNPLAIHLYNFSCLLWYFPLAKYDMCSHLFIYCIYTTRIAAQTWRLLMSSRRMCHQSVACGVPFWRSAASCSIWWYVYKTFDHVLIVILSFTLRHYIWYYWVIMCV